MSFAWEGEGSRVDCVEGPERSRLSSIGDSSIRSYPMSSTTSLPCGWPVCSIPAVWLGRRWCVVVGERGACEEPGEFVGLGARGFRPRLLFSIEVKGAMTV